MEPDAETGRGAGTRRRDAETDAGPGRRNGTQKRDADRDADRDAETGLAPRFGGPGTRNSGRNLQIREILRTFGAPNGKMQEWLNWPAWKASKPLKGFRGSNPLLSADVDSDENSVIPSRSFFMPARRAGTKRKGAAAGARRRGQTQGSGAGVGRKGRAQMASGAGVERKDRAQGSGAGVGRKWRQAQASRARHRVRIPGRYSFPRAKKAVWRFALFFVI